jgi:hypothetical protein
MRKLQARRRLGLAAVLAAIAACGTNDASKQPDPARVEAAVDAARRAADQLGPQLMTALGDALGKSGPVGAIEVCQLRAPQIAEQLSRSGKLEIGRTALRLRNPNNAPDEWEKQALEQFASELASGAAPTALEVRKVEATADGWRVRWMRPIVLQPMCVICHGDELEPDLRAELAKRYPQDQATGFKPGELRGAFTASVTVTP